MILAAPLVIPFAKAVGLSVGTLGMAALADKVNEYIQENPEESMKILSTIIPSIGIGQISMSKEKISLEDLDEMTDEEAQDLTKEEKAELMKQAGKRRNRELSIATSEKIGLSGPGKEKQDIEYEIDERYDEGGVEEKKAPFDYKRFFRKADGGAIGVESLFEERKNFRGGGTYQGRGGYGASRRTSTSAKAPPSMGFGNPPPGSGGGGGGGSTTTKTPTITRRGGGGPNLNLTKTTTPKFGIAEFAKKYNPLNLVFGTPAFADDDIEKQLDELRKQKGLTTDGGITGAGGIQIPNLEDPTVMSNIAKTAGLPTEKKKFKLGTETFGKTKLDYPTSKSENIIRDIQKFKRDPDLEFGVKDIMDLGFDKFNKLGEEKVKTIYDMVSLPNQTFVGADGGRVGFNVGGITDPAALSIYNSMSAYGFSDQEIADTITAQGYDAGTLGQTTTPDTPTAPTTPTPSEGIIGIDLQQRDTGGGFNPFGPLEPTFTRPAGSDPSISEDAFFGLGRFLQGKERGTLGNRLQKQFELGQKLPSFAAAIAGAQSPFNINSKNYNKDFVDQLNYLEGMDGLIGMSSVGLKYGPESVLFGKNVISGLGTNNYRKALEKFIAKARGDRKIKAQEELDNFLAAQEEKRKAEEQRQKDIQEAATKRTYSLQDLQDPSDRGTGQSYAAARARTASRVDSSGNVKAYGLKDGGLVSMFVEKR